ncbi:MAG TPA: hypothetical protein PKN56_19770 [Leptospiraceae bacterium]|nr:hypothetical protein [Leptospiraceae bacterium]HNN05808.1 hypothetical protein [Leptospiraceae bacterium]
MKSKISSLSTGLKIIFWPISGSDPVLVNKKSHREKDFDGGLGIRRHLSGSSN